MLRDDCTVNIVYFVIIYDKRTAALFAAIHRITLTYAQYSLYIKIFPSPWRIWAAT